MDDVTIEEARDGAASQGWKVGKDILDDDFCPECK
jgi:hypothetical protein